MPNSVGVIYEVVPPDGVLKIAGFNPIFDYVGRPR